MNKIRKIPFLSYEEIKKEQEKRIRKIIDYAYKYVPYYRRTLNFIGLRPENFKTTEDLQKLPIISKEDILKNPNDFISKDLLKNSLWVNTSGSTGQPTAVLYSEDFLAASLAITQRVRDGYANDIKIGYLPKKARFSYRGGGSETLDRYYKRKYFFLKYTHFRRFRFYSVFDPPNKNFVFLRKFNPNIVSGIGSYIDILFRYMSQNKLDLQDLKLVTYAADHLNDETRRVIEDIYCPIFAHYNAMETGTIGFECSSHNGYHLSIDTCSVELIDKDKNPVIAGKEGEILVSNLLNKGMVLLNYRLGDYGVMQKEDFACECGRNFPLLKNLIGRMDDLITLKEGRFLHPRIFWLIFKKKIDQIHQYKLIQENFEKYTVFCKLNDKYKDELDEIERDLINDLEKILGESDIKINFVSEMPRSKGGKFRSVESRIRKS